MELPDGNSDPGTRTREGSKGDDERLHLEYIYEAFRCPLTKEVMKDPVFIENGQTFERSAIEKWFMECRGKGRKLSCPLTSRELNTADMSPSIALRNAIEEWKLRNDAAQLDFARNFLSSESSENNVLTALSNVQDMCQKSRSRKQIVRNADLIPRITGMLKNPSQEVRCKALETLRIVAEDDDENKEAMAIGDTIRTIVKFLSHDLPKERREAVALLFELSKCKSVCEKIGGVPGSTLILLGINSNSESIYTVEKAEDILENLEKCEKNVLQMAQNGRLQPLLKLLMEGSPETQLEMATCLGDLVLSDEVKVLVAQTAGPTLLNILRNRSDQAREASLKALNQISSNKLSAQLLIESGVLPQLMKDLFSVGNNQLPMRLKEISAAVLANIVDCGTNFATIPVGYENQTLVSEDIICNLLHLISNTGPAIEFNLLQVLVGLTNSLESVQNIVLAIKSSCAIISLIQFTEAPQRELRAASIKLLRNISPYMGKELAVALCKTAGQLASLIKVIAEDNGISEEQVAAIELLAELPERDLLLTRNLLKEGAFNVIVMKIHSVRKGKSSIGRYANPFLEGLIMVLLRITYCLEEEMVVMFCCENNLTTLFTDLLRMNGLDKVQIASAMGLENLSKMSKLLTRVPQDPVSVNCFMCFSNKQVLTGLCRVHHGFCSARDTFCLLDAKAVERLVACLDHNNVKVVEAALAALCTLLGDDVDTQKGVHVLDKAEGIGPVLQVLIDDRSELLRRRSVYAVERILRVEEVAMECSGDPRIVTALVHAYRHSDHRTKQIAERALTMIDRLPSFSGIFPRAMIL